MPESDKKLIGAVDWALPTIGIAIACMIAFGLGYWSFEDSYRTKREKRYQVYRDAAEKLAGDGARGASEAASSSLGYREPCFDPKGREESELCAQWKAARAAEAGVLWTQRGLWIGIFGAVLSLVSIVLVLRALAHAREANEIARRDQELEKRPWLSFEVETGDLLVSGDRNLDYHLHVHVKNVGNLPANEVLIKTKLFIPDGGGDQPIILDEFIDSTEWPVLRGYTILPGQEVRRKERAG